MIAITSSWRVDILSEFISLSNYSSSEQGALGLVQRTWKRKLYKNALFYKYSDYQATTFYYYQFTVFQKRCSD